jgi:hypothetical protein
VVVSNVIDLNADPIYAAVRKWKAAAAAFNSYDGADDDPENLRLEAAYLAADDDLWWCVTPTTPAGFRLMCDTFYYNEVVVRGEGENIGLKRFLDALCQSVKVIARKA